MHEAHSFINPVTSTGTETFTFRKNNRNFHSDENVDPLTQMVPGRSSEAVTAVPQRVVAPVVVKQPVRSALRAGVLAQLGRIGAAQAGPHATGSGRSGGRAARRQTRHVSMAFPKSNATDDDVAFILREIAAFPAAAARLEKLHLSDNAITDVGGALIAAFIADSARCAPGLRVLNVGCNALSAACVEAIAAAACAPGATRTLIALNVKGNAESAVLDARLGPLLTENRVLVAEVQRARQAAQKAAAERTAALVARVAPSIAAKEIAIVGGGIAGLATAIALAKRGYRCVVFERDRSFDERAQGYGLTMQQGTRACRALGIEDAVADAAAWSSRHFIFDHTGATVAFWGPTFTARHGSGGCAGSSCREEVAWRRVAAHNLHIPRQALRRALLAKCMEQRSPPIRIEWGAEFRSFARRGALLALTFGVRRQSAARDEGEPPPSKAAAVQITVDAPAAVFCDGIHSVGRARLVGDPLEYLGLVVMLGIFDVGGGEFSVIYRYILRESCHTQFDSLPLTSLTISGAVVGGESGDGAGGGAGGNGEGAGAEGSNFGLFHERVFQTSNGETRLFVMPFSLSPRRQSMWQLTFPASEEEARRLSAGDAEVLRQEALRRCGSWHKPIPAMITSTAPALLTGYPVYDRLPAGTEQAELDAAFAHGAAESQRSRGAHLRNCGDAWTARDGGRRAKAVAEGRADALAILAGDAAHCMSPLKGQGANQALLDAIVIAEELDSALRHPAPSPAAEVEQEEGGDAVVARCVSAAWERAAALIDRRTRSKVLDSRAACAVLHQPDFVLPAFQVRRKMGTGATEGSRAVEVLDRVAEMRRAGVGALCGATGRLDRYAFGNLDSSDAVEAVAAERGR